MDLGLQGNIEKFSLPEILQLIASSRKSGTLGVQKDDSIIMVYFDKGDIVYGYGPRQTFHLGQLLREKNIISETQLEQAINIQAKNENSRRLGEILISRKFIDRADLEKVVITQIEELLYSLLTWKSGSFKFYEDQFPTEEEITVKISVENVILEGLRRIDEANMINEVFPSLDDVYIISASQGGRTRDVSLEAREWNLMALVDGYRSINEVVQYSRMKKDEALRKLAQLKLAGIITKTEKKEVPKVSDNVEQMVNRLAGLFEDYLTEKKQNRLSDRNVTETILEQK